EDATAGALRVAVRHILNQPDHANHIDLRLPPGERLHQPGDGARTAHIPFHVFHARGGLQRDAAGIEADALADERERLAPGFAARRAVPLHDDEAALARRAL